MAFHQHCVLWSNQLCTQSGTSVFSFFFPSSYLYDASTHVLIPEPLHTRVAQCPLGYLLVRGPTNGLTRSCIRAFEANRTPTRMFSSSKNSEPCKQLFLCAGKAPVTGGRTVPEVPFIHALLLWRALSSVATVLLSKKEKMVEKAGGAGTRWGVMEGLRCREVLASWNSVAYRKVGTMGTESQERHIWGLRTDRLFTTGWSRALLYDSCSRKVCLWPDVTPAVPAQIIQLAKASKSMLANMPTC